MKDNSGKRGGENSLFLFQTMFYEGYAGCREKNSFSGLWHLGDPFPHFLNCFQTRLRGEKEKGPHWATSDSMGNGRFTSWSLVLSKGKLLLPEAMEYSGSTGLIQSYNHCLVLTCGQAPVPIRVSWAEYGLAGLERGEGVGLGNAS